jgi:hypothetical protein
MAALSALQRGGLVRACAKNKRDAQETGNPKIYLLCLRHRWRDLTAI